MHALRRPRSLSALVASGLLGSVIALIAPANAIPVVAPSIGAAACSGTQVSGGGTTLQNAVRRAGAGTTFCVAAGNYTVDSAGLELQSGDKISGAGVGSTFIKSTSARQLISGSQSNKVVIQNVDVAGGTDKSTSACDASTIECGRAVAPGDNWLIQHARIHGADSQGIGSPGAALVIDDVELDHNGNKWDGPNNNGFAAGIKGGVRGGFTITNSFVHDNNQGVWCDVDCKNTEMGFIVRNNVILDNCSFGIHYENTYLNKSTPASATISDNVVKGNDWCNLQRKADIGIVSAQGATLTNNDTGATPAHPQADVGITAFNRGLGASTGSAKGNRLNGDALKCDSPFVCPANAR